MVSVTDPRDPNEERHEAAFAAIAPRRDAGPAPLSAAQRRAWILEQMDPGRATFNRPLALRLRGMLDRGALSRVLGEILRRHEILRTIFPEQDGVPVQVVLPARPVRIAEHDLERVPEAARETEARRIASKAAGRAFDLARGPLVRPMLLRLAARDHVLLLMMHHIVFDGWSESNLLAELGTLYAAFSAGRPSPLPEPKLQYGDFAAWQQQRDTDEYLDEHLAYWRRQLRDLPSTLALPTDFPRAGGSTARGGRVSFALDASASQRLFAFARTERVTPFMVLVAAFQAVLGRHASQEDVVVGVPSAGRTHAETEEMFGCFMNVLVLRGDLSGNPTFRALLHRIRQTALDAYAHQEVPFERLVDALRTPRAADRWPLFQVMFNMHVLPKRETAGIGTLAIEPFAFDSGAIGGLDLSLRVDQDRSGLTCTLSYAQALFLPATIERMAAGFRTFLEAALAEPERTIGTLPILGEEERRQVLVDWNRTEARYPTDRCIHELFEAQVARTPDAFALEFERERLTYGELDRRANRLARRLRALGVRPEERVALLLHRSPEMLIAILAVLKGGGAYVPLDPWYPVDRLAFLIGDAGATILLTQRRLAEVCRSLAPTVVEVDDGVDPDEIADRPTSPVAPHNAAYVIYTSGSTGTPKGVVVCHSSVCNHLHWRHEYFRMGAGDRLLQVASYCFDDSIWEFFEPLTVGACVVMMRRHDTAHLASLIADHEITAVCLVPSLLRTFLDEDLSECTRLRRVSTGAETLPVDLVERHFQRLDAELYNGYGPTEATVAVTYWKCEAPVGRSSVPIGRPIGNTRIYVLDERLQPVPIGVAGELHIGGACLARGYLNAPEVTAERFITDPFSVDPGARLYKTGDRARYLPDGNLEFLGRLDNQIKLRGFRIEPGEIETALAQHPAVGEAVVAAAESPGIGRQLVAYVVFRDGAAAATGELRAFIAKRLPDYMIPSAFVALDAMPLGQNGKIDRRALRPPERPNVESPPNFVAPRTPLEQQLAAIWVEVLGVERVGPDDNFFELGGHSLAATQVISRMRKAFDVDLSLRSFFEAPTLSAMATAAMQGIGRQAVDLTRRERSARRARS
jgi:amino acid adenylation domain-containing protein